MHREEEEEEDGLRKGKNNGLGEGRRTEDGGEVKYNCIDKRRGGGLGAEGGKL